jgi:transcriptional regulator with XRE-family HTH domain
VSTETPKDGLQDPAFISWSQEATVGERIRLLLEVCQLKQTEVAQKMGITQAAISNWITGSSRKPNSSSLFRLADVLGSNPTWIIYGEGEPFSQRSSPAVVLHPETIPKTALTNKREKKAEFKLQQVLPTTEQLCRLLRAQMPTHIMHGFSAPIIVFRLAFGDRQSCRCGGQRLHHWRRSFAR